MRSPVRIWPGPFLMIQVDVKKKTSDPTLNLVLDTLEKKKQALVFVNTKRSAEKVAEDISRKLPLILPELAEKARTVLPSPTQQCERLAKCIAKGIAFHHAGLHSKQRELIEEHFKKGTIKIICATPTLAAGVDLPAFRTIIRDVHRYGGREGMYFIPVLEYLQMSGRAGRPSYDDYGEAILVAKTKPLKDEMYNRYICGVPENIYSKLAVEPVLRTYCLSLIATKFVSTRKELIEFFSKTFWAYQYQDMKKLSDIIDRILVMLADWGFLQQSDFIAASDYDDQKYRATFLGKRVAELYLDPLTAYYLVTSLERASRMKTLKPVSFIQAVCHTLEMRPLLRVGVKEWDEVQEKLAEIEAYLLDVEPSMYDTEFEDFMRAIKTSLMMLDWIEEKDEQYLLENYNVRPGETRVKLARADWLLYCTAEIANIMQKNELIKEIKKVRIRLKYGVKEELLPLLRLKQVGRVRARKLYRNGIKTLRDVKKVDIIRLAGIVGKKVAVGIKEQVGQKQGIVA